MTNFDEQILKELEMLRRLKMMELSKAGVSQSQLADALGVNQSTVSRLMATRKQTKDGSAGKSAKHE